MPTDQGPSRPLVQTTLNLPRPPDAHLDELRLGEWRTKTVDAPFVPKETRRRWEPKPKTAKSQGNVLAWAASCGRGKSTMVRHLQAALLRANPKARVLVMTVNRIYATSAFSEQERLVQQLRGEGVAVKVASYLDKGANLESCEIVLCSFESLYRVDGQRFDLIVMDEASSLARLVGGGTMQNLDSVHSLRFLCHQMGTRVLALDADLCFKMDASEPTTVSQDFFSVLFPERPVLCHRLSDSSKPDHLKRSIHLFFGCGSKEDAKRQNVDLVAPAELWWAELVGKVNAWHRDQSVGLIFISAGTVAFGRLICKWLLDRNVRLRFYHGESDQKARFADLRDPASAWAGLGAVVCTTAIGAGVDIKGPAEGGIAVSAIFTVFVRTGCSFQQQCQSLVRARHVGDNVMRVLLGCMPPALRAAMVEAGKRQPIVRPTFNNELDALIKRRGTALYHSAREEIAGGGLPAGVKAPWKPVADGVLRVMAHARFERKMQMVDPYYAAMQLFQHHGWSVAVTDEVQTSAPVDPDTLAAPILTDSEEFDIEMSIREKWLCVCVQIAQRGEGGFFDQECYGWASQETTNSNTLSTLQLWILKAYWGLRHVGYLPGLDTLAHDDADDDDAAGDEAHASLETDEPPECVKVLECLLGNGKDAQSKVGPLTLNALCHCLEPEDIMRDDYVNRLNPSKKKKDLQLVLPMGYKMRCVESLGKLLLGDEYRRVRQLVEGVPIGQHVVDAANRFKEGTHDRRDEMLVRDLRRIKDDLQLGNKGSTIVQILVALAEPMGMTLDVKMGKQRRVAGQKKGKKVTPVASMTLVRVLPELVDAWLVYSPTLLERVRVDEWQQKHDDTIESHYHRDPDYGDAFVKPFAVNGERTGDIRHEKLDGAALKVELARLDRLTTSSRTETLEKELAVLNAFDKCALKPDANQVRLVPVVYGKPSGMGRRIASYPAAAHCPKRLRKLLFGRFYHDQDISNCHPTIQLQRLSPKERDRVPTLREYVENPKAMRQDIAAHYGCSPAVAKDGVHRVLNGGSIEQWKKDFGLRPAPLHGEHGALRDLREEARVIRESFFAQKERDEPGVVQRLRAEARAHLMAEAEREQRKALAPAANTPDPSMFGDFELVGDGGGEPSAKRAKISRPISNAAVDRSAFSRIMFELEDQVLDVVDTHLRAQGWIVASLIYDGLHVEHRGTDTSDPATGKWVQLEAAMRGAEEAVRRRLDYRIALVEKPLFEEAGGNGDGEGGEGGEDDDDEDNLVLVDL